MLNIRLIFVMFLWALCFPLITIGIAYSPHLTFAAIRAFLAGVALLIIAIALGQRLPERLEDWVALTVIGIGATSLAFFGMFHAAEFVSPGIATVIASVQPLVAALMAHLFLNERLGPYARGGLFLGFLGIVFVSVPQIISDSADAFQIGTAYIFVAAIGISISNIMIKRTSKKIDPLMAMGCQLVIGSVPLALAAVATEDPRAIEWTVEFLVSLFVLSLVGTSLVYWIWCRILKTVDLSYANSFTFLVPLFGLILGMSFYNETVSVFSLLGIFVTLLGIFLVAVSKRIETY